MANKRSWEQEHDDIESNWGRLVYIAKRHFDLWQYKNIKPRDGNLKLSYMPFIFNINLRGSTSGEISRKAVIAKQNMSKTTRELVGKGMIVAEKLQNDKRSYKITLTEKGKNFVKETHLEVAKLVSTYKELVGEEAYETAVEVMQKIIRYHEDMANEAHNIDIDNL